MTYRYRHAVASKVLWQTVDHLSAPLILLRVNDHLLRITAAFAMNYNFPHDFADKGVLNVLDGVLYQSDIYGF